MAPKKAVAVNGELKSAEPASGSSNVKPKPVKIIKPVAHPSTMSMIVEVLKKGERKGTSVQAIRSQILAAHPTVDPLRLKFLLRSALSRGIEKGILIRPLNSSASGATGRFKLAKTGKPKLEKSSKMSENVDPNVEAKEVKPKKVEKPKKVKAAKEDSKGEKEKKPKVAAKKPDQEPEKVKPAATVKDSGDKAEAAAAPLKAKKEKVVAGAEGPVKPKKELAKPKVPAKEAKGDTAKTKAKKDPGEPTDGKSSKKGKK